MDCISYNLIFSYLYENYNFLPKIIYIDFEQALVKAINENIYYSEKNIIIVVFFFLLK